MLRVNLTVAVLPGPQGLRCFSAGDGSNIAASTPKRHCRPSFDGEIC